MISTSITLKKLNLLLLSTDLSFLTGYLAIEFINPYAG